MQNFQLARLLPCGHDICSYSQSIFLIIVPILSTFANNTIRICVRLKPVMLLVLSNNTCTVHDTKNLTFSKEFCGCSVRTPADSCAERRGFSSRVPRNFRVGAAELPRGRMRIPHRRTQIFHAGGRRSSAQTGTDLPCGLGLKMAETRRQTSCATTLKDRETRRKDRSNYHYRNRTYLEMKYE